MNTHSQLLALRAVTAMAAVVVGTSVARADTTGDSPYVPEGYVKVFSDEMNGSELDTSKWWTRYIYEDGMLATLNDERQLYRENNNHVMTGSALELTARRIENPTSTRFLYESGMIRSKPTFKYGYFETRVKMPAGLGCWPGFWMGSDSDAGGRTEWPPEIDFFEFVNNGGNDRSDMLHMGVVVKKHKNEGPNPWGGRILAKHDDVRPRGELGGAIYDAPFEFPEDFHVFGGLWDTDDTVSIFVDGKLLVKFDYKWVHQDGREAPYAHLLLNLAIGGSWAGKNGIDDAAFPQALEVDYVRVYQKQGQQKVGRSTIGHDLTASVNRLAADTQDGPTPYPDPKDEAAWPGEGPIRVFPWMSDNRAFFWSRRDKDQDAIVFVGDSLVGNWKADAFKAAFHDLKVANRGIGGDGSRGVLFRMKEDVLDLNPKAIVLLIGSNDLSAHADPAVVAGNIAAILKQARDHAPQLPIVLCTLPPRNSPKAPLREGALADLNTRIRELGAAHEGVLIMDLHKAFSHDDGTQIRECFQDDLLHLTPKAYEKWAELLRPVLSSDTTAARAN